MRSFASRSTGIRHRVVMGCLSAFVSLLALGVARPVSAAVIHVDIVPDLVWFKPLFLDVDNDGTMDLLFDYDSGCVGNCQTIATLGALNGEILMANANDVTRLSTGMIVGPGTSTFGSGGLLATDRFAGFPPVTFFEDGLWDNDSTAFAGFRFLNASGVHYGWVRARIEETSNQITIFDYAYESLADTRITAGAVPEPATLGLVLLAAGAAATLRRARRR